MAIPLLLQRGLNLGGEFESLGHGDNLLLKPQFVPVFSIVKDLNSVTGGKGLTVAPSPLNEVKLDLGIILVVGVLLLLVQGRVVDSLPLQLLLLLSYGLLGMSWIIVRVRRVMAKLDREREQSSHDPQ
ncbi:MAG: hypothetical protein MZV65_32335 [Chromatiales bacterium]|nr:hypothetical protein [Chromatiales bacterium]